jgi:hypothetical protein
LTDKIFFITEAWLSTRIEMKKKKRNNEVSETKQEQYKYAGYNK